MHMQDIRIIAKQHGIKTSRVSKVNLIHRIQLEEGNFNCFASAKQGECDQANCLWRNDCFATAKKLDS